MLHGLVAITHDVIFSSHKSIIEDPHAQSSLNILSQLYFYGHLQETKSADLKIDE